MFYIEQGVGTLPVTSVLGLIVVTVLCFLVRRSLIEEEKNKGMLVLESPS